MSAESKEKAREHGLKSGKGAQLLSKLLGRVGGSSENNDEDDEDDE